MIHLDSFSSLLVLPLLLLLPLLSVYFSSISKHNNQNIVMVSIDPDYWMIFNLFSFKGFAVGAIYFLESIFCITKSGHWRLQKDNKVKDGTKERHWSSKWLHFLDSFCCCCCFFQKIEKSFVKNSLVILILINNCNVICWVKWSYCWLNLHKF